MDDLPSNDFVERCRRDCIIKRDTVVCGKYRVVRWLHDVAREKELSYGPFKVIKIPSTNHQSILPELPKTRNLKFGVSETLNFVRDIAEHLIKRRAIIYTYEPVLFNSRSFAAGPMILDEDELAEMQRGRTLTELFKLKLMLIPIFLGVHLIKKLIIIGGLFLPGLLSKLRICKVPQPSHPFHAWSTAGETPVDYPTGYGHDDPGWSHRNDIYPIGGYGGAYHNSHSPYSYYRQRR
ncbi:hypothetical protein PV325_008346 [Microctonus aethiopoides]|nr:hypothetical protein PV325_008346 [Microctonus aethiopoides]